MDQIKNDNNAINGGGSDNNVTNNKKEKHNNALKWILVLGIVIVLNLFFSFSIRLVYERPQWEDFCGEKQSISNIETEEQCIEIGGKWTEENFPKLAPEDPVQRNTYCDATFTCRQEFEDANALYNRNLFVVMVILGVLSITLGIYVSVTSVSLGLSLGGVLALVIGSMSYWSRMNDILKVIVLAIALAALIWVGIKKLRD